MRGNWWKKIKEEFITEVKLIYIEIYFHLLSFFTTFLYLYFASIFCFSHCQKNLHLKKRENERKKWEKKTSNPNALLGMRKYIEDSLHTMFISHKIKNCICGFQKKTRTRKNAHTSTSAHLYQYHFLIIGLLAKNHQLTNLITIKFLINQFLELLLKCWSLFFYNKIILRFFILKSLWKWCQYKF